MAFQTATVIGVAPAYGQSTRVWLAHGAIGKALASGEVQCVTPAERKCLGVSVSALMGEINMTDGFGTKLLLFCARQHNNAGVLEIYLGNRYLSEIRR